MKQVAVNIYRWGHEDCSNNGLTSKIDRAWLFIDCSQEEAIEWCNSHCQDASRNLILVRRKLWGQPHDYVEPLVKPKGQRQMMGGNFVYSCDSRFHEYTGSWQPIAVHDRFETEEEYELYSK